MEKMKAVQVHNYFLTKTAQSHEDLRLSARKAVEVSMDASGQVFSAFISCQSISLFNLEQKAAITAAH